MNGWEVMEEHIFSLQPNWRLGPRASTYTRLTTVAAETFCVLVLGDMSTSPTGRTPRAKARTRPASVPTARTLRAAGPPEVAAWRGARKCDTLDCQLINRINDKKGKEILVIWEVSEQAHLERRLNLSMSDRESDRGGRGRRKTCARSSAPTSGMDVSCSSLFNY